TYSLASLANVENLTLTGTDNIDGSGNSLANVITGNAGNNKLTGGAGDDRLIGGAGDDTLDGGDGKDVLTGGDGNDVLTGDQYDVLIGGTGDDTYLIQNADVFGYLNDSIIVEQAGQGIDTIVVSTVTASLAPFANIENLTLTGSRGDGTGNDLNNVITGNDGDNVLDGGAGDDTLIGGKGDDTYVLDSTGDKIVELAGQGRNDTVKYGLGDIDLTTARFANIENAVLTGHGAFNLTGTADNNHLTGNDAANILTGGAGDDFLDGGAGNDVMNGGDGVDTYYVDSVDDVIIDSSGNYDTVISGNISLDLSTMWNNQIEEGALRGTANLNLTGNAANNQLSGNEGANIITGNGGNDMIGAAGGDDTVYGNDGNDWIDGGNGNDTLIGGAGDDTLSGGLGKDTFVYNDLSDAGTGKDVITDFTHGDDAIQLTNLL